jgi:predicted adenine nucleotide alpha hydrolase (AANH) superfamily ATPase
LKKTIADTNLEQGHIGPGCVAQKVAAHLLQALQKLSLCLKTRMLYVKTYELTALFYRGFTLKTNTDRERYVLPEGHDKLLLHSCCAPCSGEVMEGLIFSGIDYSIFFYNPNIHPKKEYEIRKEENIRFAKKHGIPFIDADYDVENWFERAKGMEQERERGIRCTMCFDMRFERTALYAFENEFSLISSSLGISRWKNFEQINESGVKAASHYPGINYWTYNWRKNGGASRMIEISKQEQFYQQEYCGCAYSLRDSNRWRNSKGRESIRIGEKYYEPVQKKTSVV